VKFSKFNQELKIRQQNERREDEPSDSNSTVTFTHKSPDQRSEKIDLSLLKNINAAKGEEKKGNKFSPTLKR